MAEEPQFCYACYGTNLQVVDGALVCQDCGTQAQAQLEESEFQEVGGQGTGRLRRIRVPVQRRLRLEEATITPEEVSQRLQQQATAYLHCLQALLQEQCKALPNLLGVAPEVCGLVRHLWFLLLPHTRLLDTTHFHTPNSVEEGKPDQPTAAASQSQGDGAAGLLGSPSAKRKASGSSTNKGANSSRYIFNIAGTRLKHGSLAGQRGQWAAELSDEEGAREGDGGGGVELGQQGNGDGEEQGEGPMGNNSRVDVGMRAGSQQGEAGEGVGEGQGDGGGGGAGPGEEGAMEVDDDRDLDFSGVESEQRAGDRLVRTGQHPWSVAKMFARELHPQVTLALCFLACVATKQAVFPHDMVRLALDGQLPYLHPTPKCIAYLDTLPRAVAAPVRLLMAPDGCGAVSELLVSATEIAALLRIELPTINGPVLLYRAVTDLVLPEEVWMASHELYSLYLHDTALMTLTATTATHSPYTLLLTLVAMAVRVCYGLDGSFKGWPRFPFLPPPPTAPSETADETAETTMAASPAAGTGTAASQGGGTLSAGEAGIDGVMAGQQVVSAAQQQPGMRATRAPAADTTTTVTTANQKRVEGGAAPALPNHVPLLEAFLSSPQVKELPHKQQTALKKSVAFQARLQQERVEGAQHMAVSGWPAWSRARIQEWGNQQSYPISSSEAAALSDEQLLDYLQYLRLHIAGEHAVPFGLKELDAYLQQLGPDALRAPQRPENHTAGADLNQTGATRQHDAAAAGAGLNLNQATAGHDVQATAGMHQQQAAAGPSGGVVQHAATRHAQVASNQGRQSQAGPSKAGASQTAPGVIELSVNPSQADLQPHNMPMTQAEGEDMPFMATQQWGFTQATMFQFGAADAQPGPQPGAAANAAQAPVTGTAAAAAGGVIAGASTSAAAPAGAGTGQQGALANVATADQHPHQEGVAGPSRQGPSQPDIRSSQFASTHGCMQGAAGPMGHGSQNHGAVGPSRGVAGQLPGLNGLNGGATDGAEESGGLQPALGSLPYVYERIQQPIADTRFHADLMAVVCACSAYANVQPRVMLRLLALFDKYMCKTEEAAEKIDSKEKKGSKSATTRMALGSDQMLGSDASGGSSKDGADMKSKPPRRARQQAAAGPHNARTGRVGKTTSMRHASAGSESDGSEEGEGSEGLEGQGDMEEGSDE